MSESRIRISLAIADRVKRWRNRTGPAEGRKRIVQQRKLG